MKIVAPMKSLYAFVAVAETGSMTAAAKALYVSHSAISQAIKTLEQQLEQPLFTRVGRQVVLNSAGRQYYRRVAPALEEIVAATSHLLANRHSNRLTLNMVNSLAMHWWIPRVSQFNQHAPDIDIRISTLIGQFVLEEEGVDVALIHGNTSDWQDYYCEKLADDELVLVASPEVARQCYAGDVEDAHLMDPAVILTQQPAIVALNDRRKNDWQIWSEAHQLALPTFAKNLSFSASIQAVQAATRHLGVLVTHRMFVRDDIKLGYLVEIGQPVLNPHQAFYFACAKEKLKNEHVLILRNWMRSEFNETCTSTTN